MKDEHETSAPISSTKRFITCLRDFREATMQECSKNIKRKIKSGRNDTTTIERHGAVKLAGQIAIVGGDQRS